MAEAGAAAAAPAHCTQSQFAARQGWSKSYVSKLKATGRLVLTSDGLVAVAASLERIKATTGAPERASADVVGQIFMDAKDRREHYDAEMARIKVEREVGTLRDAAEVDAVLADAAATLRAHLEAWPERVAAPLAALRGDEDRIRATLREHVADVLAELARNFARMASGGQASGATS